MIFYPSALWRGPVPTETPSAGISHIGVILHTQEGTEVGTTVTLPAETS